MLFKGISCIIMIKYLHCSYSCQTKTIKLK